MISKFQPLTANPADNNTESLIKMKAYETDGKWPLVVNAKHLQNWSSEYLSSRKIEARLKRFEKVLLYIDFFTRACEQSCEVTIVLVFYVAHMGEHI